MNVEHVHVRTATEDDIGAIAALWSRLSLGGGDEVNRAEIAERLRHDDNTFVVAEVTDAAATQLVGTVMGCYDGHRGWIKRVAVDPEKQHAGIAQQMMGEVETRFRARGVTHLRLSAFADNGRALDFWDAQGWQHLSEIRYFTKSLG